MKGESGRCIKSSPAHPKDSQGDKGLGYEVANMYENYVSCSVNHSFTVWAQMNCGIVILEYARAIREGKNPLMEKPGPSVYSGSQLTSVFWVHNVAEHWPEQLNQSQIITCTVSTVGTSFASLLTLMHPSLWNRVNLCLHSCLVSVSSVFSVLLLISLLVLIFKILFHQMLNWSRSRWFKSFSWPYFFLKDDGSPQSFHVLIMHQTLLNPMLAVSESP